MQGNIARWLKKEGDKVSPGEVLCEVETVRHSPVCWLYPSSSLFVSEITILFITLFTV